MEEFAAAAGVSRPTASKYFAAPGSVRPAIRERLRLAAERLDYHPNLFAVNLNRRSPRTLGVVVPSLSDPFYAEVVRQVELGAIAAGYWSIVLSSHADPALEARAVQILAATKVAGVLIAPLGAGAPHVDALRRLIPTVLVDSRADEAGAFVGTDNAQSVGLLVDYLCGTGEPPCFVAMPDVNRNARERRAAYAAAMGARGHRASVVEACRTDWSFEAVGAETAARAFEAGGFPSRTLLCANDRIAFGVMAEAYRRGLRVGRGEGCALRVAGHDDHPLSRFSCPPLTTAAQDVAAIATAALAMLMGRIGAPDGSRAPGETVSFAARLVVRDSA